MQHCRVFPDFDQVTESCFLFNAPMNNIQQQEPQTCPDDSHHVMTT